MLDLSLRLGKITFFLLIVTMMSCGDGLPPDPFADQRDILLANESSGISSINVTIARTNFLLLPFRDVSDLEDSGIRFIREEEKAVQDFLDVMSQRYDDQILVDLLTAEQSHFAAAGLAMQKYGTDDPTNGNGIGEFISPNLQAYYNTAIEQGEIDLLSALQVATRMQEASHVTIFNQLSRVANNRDLRMVYHALLPATRNHMRLMHDELSSRGVTYAPMFISNADYLEIISGAIEFRSSSD